MIKKTLRQMTGKATMFILLCIVGFVIPLTSFAENLAQRQDVRKFIDEMVTKHDFNRAELTDLLAQGEIKTKIIDAMNRPAEGMPWYKYRKIFLKPGRVKAGVAFWNENKDALKRAESKYGVPAEYIVAIIGVETRYGVYKGTFRVLDSLMTLGFDYPKRGKFFRSELEQYLLMTREEGVDPLSLKGSYAGAMGKPQFISSSYRSYAVDFDGDGKKDLLNNTTDAIGSVANYFSKHHWAPGQPVVGSAKIKGKKYKALLDKGIKPKTSIKKFSQYGVTITDDIPGNLSAALIELELKSGHEYWAGLQNFYVITRYNHSPLYAMAVYQLSQEILALHSASLASNKSGASGK
jgi:membrane-bound lytic murein transglycosylase B